MMIDHTGHGHPNTAAARKACRKIFADARQELKDRENAYLRDHGIRPEVDAYIRKHTTSHAKIDREPIGSHCELCGSTDPENINTGDDPELQGYSACCNEPVVDDCSSCQVCTRCGSHDYDRMVTGINPHGRCGMSYCHYALED